MLDTTDRQQMLAAIDRDPLAVYESAFGEHWRAWLARIPTHCQPGLVRFMLFGIKPGSFLCAVLANERELAERRADDVNRAALASYSEFLWNGAPTQAWGSPARVQAWCERGGQLGKEAAA